MPVHLWIDPKQRVPMILHRHIEKQKYVTLLVDLITISLSWACSFVIRFQANIIAVTKGVETTSHLFRLWPLLMFCYIFIFIKRQGASPAQLRGLDEWFVLLRQHSVAFLIFITCSFFLFEHRYSRVTLALFFILTLILVPMGRHFVRALDAVYLRLKRPKYKKKTLIIGEGPQALVIQKAVQHRPEWELKVVGSFSFTDFKEQEHTLENLNLDVVFIIPSRQESAHVDTVYARLQQILAEVFVVPYFGESIFLQPRLVTIQGVTAIALNTSNLDPLGQFLKRAFDMVFSLCFLCVFAPVFALCALLVKLTSKGPVFYAQERMGLDGRKFMCLKFRGMVANAEADSGPVWAQKQDNRTTTVGKWLRRTSLDEIPQFFNVLKGDMSVVGPRPERPVFIESFRKEIPGYMLRHKVKTGITGWAQINGWRGNTSLEKRIQCDLWYIQNWSFWLDLKIIVLTPFKGFIHPNAY